MSQNDMKNLKLLIIEAANLLDELCSSTLCHILKIDKHNSKSFGFGSASLSFNTKITLLSDIATVEKDLKNKFTTIAEIRNKFAHIYSINSFETYYNLDDNSKSNCNKLFKWYTASSTNDEDKFIDCFIQLYTELSDFMMDLNHNIAYERGFEKGKVDTNLNLLDRLVDEFKKTKDGKVVLLNILSEMK